MPKPKLLGNARHELFAQEIAKGSTYTAAYAKVGYRPDQPNASRLANMPHVQARVQEIVGNAAARTDIKVERILQELAHIGFANMLDYVSVGHGGDANLDLTGLTRDTAAAISEIVVDTHNAKDGKDTVVVRRVRFKLLDKRAALVDLGKHLGMFKERAARDDEDVVADAPTETPELSPLQIGRRIAFALERAKRPQSLVATPISPQSTEPAMTAALSRPRLTLRQPAQESAPVREAKQIARDAGYDGDPHMIAFALALIEARDSWNNRPQSRPRQFTSPSAPRSSAPR